MEVPHEQRNDARQRALGHAVALAQTTQQCGGGIPTAEAVVASAKTFEAFLTREPE